jgi:hypothetical protein
MDYSTQSNCTNGCASFLPAQSTNVEYVARHATVHVSRKPLLIGPHPCLHPRPTHPVSHACSCTPINEALANSNPCMSTSSSQSIPIHLHTVTQPPLRSPCPPTMAQLQLPPSNLRLVCATPAREVFLGLLVEV